MSTQRVLPADIYDTLEFSALAYGGIGSDWLYEDFGAPDEMKVPLCILGHADIATASSGEARYGNPIRAALRTAWGDGSDWGPANANNGAVHHLNERKSRPISSRVTFEEWCAELNIVRGD